MRLYQCLALSLLCKLSWLGTRNDDILPLWGSGRRGTKIMVVRPLEFFHNLRQQENKVIRKLFSHEKQHSKAQILTRQLKSKDKESVQNLLYKCFNQSKITLQSIMVFCEIVKFNFQIKMSIGKNDWDLETCRNKFEKNTYHRIISQISWCSISQMIQNPSVSGSIPPND